jgi:hypothetical protein
MRKPQVRWIAKSTVVTLIPNVIDDISLHHTPLSLYEILHVGVDVATVNTISSFLAFVSKL